MGAAGSAAGLAATGLAATVLAVLTALTACSTGGARGPTPPATAGPTSTDTSTGTAAPAELPDDDAGHQAAWVVERLADADDPAVVDVEARFTDGFLAEVPAARLVEVLASIRAAGPWTPVSVDGGAQGLVVRLAGPQDDLDMQLAVDAEGRIAGLLFTPAAPPRDPASSWGDLTGEVEALPGSTSLLVARVEGGRCVPLDGMPAGSAAGESLPIGSIVKLYVLGAVVDAVEAGRLTWDRELTLTDELRSLPSGRLQDEPAGTVLTVEEAARDMIAISDNTATDLLVDALGRDAVERALADLGHADPARNVPLATTRELFHVGWGGGEDLRTRWRGADPSGRAAILAGLPAGPPELDPQEMAGVAAWTDDVDWFATAADLCAAHAALAERASTDAGAPLREVLSANPGVAVDDAAWSHVAFKGGSSVGTMAGAWYAEPADGGDPVVVVLQSAVAVPAQALPAETLVGIAEDALALAR
ncbi:Cpe/LpqF family protein [Cellulomonas carbonis]|uniref:Cpe/LpqF family protein n=1 Tax=Cellulomonas carbonis TaxID=1386092 RepID=UPI001378B47F|nr:Cpe/LpqF family protein [Cellulomonas carbonis]